MDGAERPHAGGNVAREIDWQYRQTGCSPDEFVINRPTTALLVEQSKNWISDRFP